MLSRKIISLLFIAMTLAYSTMTCAMSVELVDTSPSSPAVLNNDEALYVRIHYKSGQPLRFQAIGSKLGDSLMQHVKLNPSQAYPAGEGNAIAWVSYDKVTEIDSIKVTVYDANWQSVKTVSLPLSANWLASRNTIKNPVAAWAKQLNQEQQESVNITQGSFSLVWSIFVFFMFASVPAYWILQTILVLKWSGKWRTLAGLPLIVSIPLLVYTIYAAQAGSNLWPLMMIFICPLLFIYLLVIICSNNGKMSSTIESANKL